MQGEISTSHHWLTIMKSFQSMLIGDVLPLVEFGACGLGPGSFADGSC